MQSGARFLFLGLCVLIARPLYAQAPPQRIEPIRGTVEIAERTANFTYHFNHNALDDIVEVGDFVFVLTRSGNLLKLATNPQQLVASAIVRGRGTAIARDDKGQILIGTEDGQIGTVDVETLAVRPLLRASGAIEWLSASSGRIVAAIRPPVYRVWPVWPGESTTAADARRKTTLPPWTILVSDSQGTRTFALPEGAEPSVRHIDRVGRLWMGEFLGEFGGKLSWMDLTSGRVHELEVEHGVGGFFETRTGRLLAFGGTSHFFLSRAFIAEVDTNRARVLYSARFSGPVSENTRPPTNPAAPIVVVMAEPGGAEFQVLSGGYLYRTDHTFTSWTRGRQIEGRFLPVSRRTLQWTAHGQFPTVILDVWSTSAGLLFLQPSAIGDPVWRLSDGEWTSSALCPNRLAQEDPSRWGSNASPVVDDANGIVTHCEATVSPGPRALVRFDSSGQLTTLDVWTEGRNDPSMGDILRAPDGTWLALGFRGEPLRKREGSAWNPAGPGPPQYDLGRTGQAAARAFVPLWQDGERSALVWRAGDGDVFALRRGEDGEWRLDDGGIPGLAHVRDAMADGDDAVLAIGSRGLVRYQPATATLQTLQSPYDDDVVSVTRDSLGRLWAAGERVHVSSDDGKTWDLVELPMMSPSPFTRVRAYPPSPGAVVLSLGERGVIIIE